MGKKATARKARWNVKTYDSVNFRWRKDDGDLCRMMASVPSKNGYIMSLVRKDIEERKRDGRWAEGADGGSGDGPNKKS